MFSVRGLKGAGGPILLFCFFALLESSSAYRWPTPQYDALERFLYEGSRDENSGLFELLKNCSRRTFFSNDPNEKQKSTIAAEWLRVAYHDMATYNITDQTGGLDASIHFETDRAENVGQGITTTLSEYDTFPNKYVSRADVIAFGGAFAVADCGGPNIPLRGGRVDASKEGLPGVPEPEQDLKTHTEKFRLQGFNSTEMIELVACGHTLGGVQSEDFPRIVHPPTDGRANFSSQFDTTLQFDTAVVSAYLNDTTLNPLVVGANITTRSDLRIFNSDGNVTMKALANPTVFHERCSTLLERMLHTVPRNVQLTEQIDILPEKPRHASLRLLGDKLTFFTTLRLARPTSEPFTDRSLVSLYWCDRYGDNSNCKRGTANKIKGGNDSPFNKKVDISPLTRNLGLNLRYYSFQAPIDPVSSIFYFWYEVQNSDGSTTLYDNSGDKYQLTQDQIIAPSHEIPILDGRVLPDNTLAVTRFAVAAVRKELKPSRVYARVFDSTHGGLNFKDPVDFVVELTRNASISSAPGYDAYSTQFELVGGGTSLDFHVDVDGKTFVLDFQASETDMHLDVPLGTVEKVSYTGRKVGADGDKDKSSTTGLTVPGVLFAMIALTTSLVL